MIIYKGPSLINGTPSVVIAVPDSNPKTGRVLMTWILRQDRPPEVAAYDGSDRAICGDCKFRDGPAGRTCYVRLSPSEGADEALPPSEVWRKWKAGKFNIAQPDVLRFNITQPDILRPEWEFTSYVGPLHVRIASYGDPAAVPTRVWEELVRYKKPREWTGFTHLWRTADPTLKRLCMASVDTPEERVEAQILGWRTFFVKPQSHSEDSGSRKDILCPATDYPRRNKVGPAGDRIPVTCAACGLCGGTSIPAPSIWEVVHGKNRENHTWE